MSDDYPEEQLRQLLGFIGNCRDKLRMQGWNVVLHPGKLDNPDTYASTWQANYHQTLNIELGPEFFSQTPEAVTNTIVHELIHAQHRDVSRLWERATTKGDYMGAQLASEFDLEMHTAIERFVSWLAQQIVVENPGRFPAYDPSDTYEHGGGLYLLGELVE